MAKSFSVQLKDDVDLKKMVDTLKAGAKDEGVTFEGDTTAGKVYGKGLNATYTVKEKTVSCTVSLSAPASWKYSEDEVVTKIKAWLKPYTK